MSTGLALRSRPMVSDCTHLRTLAFRRRNFDSRRVPRKMIVKPIKQRAVVMIDATHKKNYIAP
jgi:hypothetical protein